jgi:Mn2+/Fe2+ NRAMP family transporter
VFIIFSAMIFLYVGRPVKVLVIVGALNAFVLPLALTIVLLVSQKKEWMGSYRHPKWLVVAGWIVMLGLLALCYRTVTRDLFRLWE